MLDNGHIYRDAVRGQQLLIDCLGSIVQISPAQARSSSQQTPGTNKDGCLSVCQKTLKCKTQQRRCLGARMQKHLRHTTHTAWESLALLQDGKMPGGAPCFQ
eukprot:scaffold69114_cov15-Tisochrysis_lutea.AAC.1